MGDNAPAVTRAVALLRALASRAAPAPAATLARDLGLPRSSVYHLLAALEREGMVVRYPEAMAYGLGVGVFELGSAYLRSDPLERLARPLLLRLVDEVRLTAHLGVLHGRETLYLIKESPRNSVTLVTDVGVRLPASLTAVGRAMLAELPRSQVRALFPDASAFVDRTGEGPRTPAGLRDLLARERRQGWAEERGHVSAGIASVAACVRDHEGRPAAAVGVTFRADTLSHDERERLVARVRAAAEALGRRLGPGR